jgi:hypothetical protein
MLHLKRTERFTVLTSSDDAVTNKLNQNSAEDGVETKCGMPSPVHEAIPVLVLEDLLLHEHRKMTKEIQHALLSGLQKEGYVLLTTSFTSRPAQIIQAMRNSILNNLFPGSYLESNNNEITSLKEVCNTAALKTSDMVYVSEKGVPMYKLGYELCEDHVREVYRIAAGDADEAQVWPANETDSQRTCWLQGLGLLRHITDTALDLLIALNDAAPRRKHRRYSGASSWMKSPSSSPISERQGDFSVLYAMHYFNNENKSNMSECEQALEPTLPEPGVAVKAHVDPSLFVCEPFLCPDSKGLQVLIRSNDGLTNATTPCRTNEWLDCDGPESPLIGKLSSLEPHRNEIILLFIGKAIQTVIPDLEPTLHRVVAGNCARRTVIYEQKYEEFFPAPILD